MVRLRCEDSDLTSPMSTCEILTFAAVLSLGIGFVVSPIGILVGSLVALGFMERRRDRRKKLQRLIADMEGNEKSAGHIP